MCISVPVLGCVCLSASGFRYPWSWIAGGCEQPTRVWELAWLLCKSRQRSSLLSHFSSLPTSPFPFCQRSQPMEWWATYVHLNASATALETGTSKGHVPSRSFQTQASSQRREAGRHSRLHSGHGKKFSLTKTLWEAKAGFQIERKYLICILKEQSGCYRGG